MKNPLFFMHSFGALSFVFIVHVFSRRNEESTVLDLFKMSLRGSIFAQSEGRRLILDEQSLKAKSSCTANAPMPKLGGFHFSRPPPVSLIDQK